MNCKPLSDSELEQIDAYWRAANYLSIGQIYLYDNPLLKTPLAAEHVKARLLGHWGSCPGLNFLYAHINRAIKKYDLNALFVTGPGHGAPAVLANTYLEGSYSEFYPDISQDEAGMKKFFKQFSFPGGIPSHAAPNTPGSIHEGGELGYCLAHAYGAAFDNPTLWTFCVVGDGEAETGPLATSWHSNKFLNPVHDGAVVPILHLNGYKIAEPTLLARIPTEELKNLFLGYGYAPFFVEGTDPKIVHQELAAAFDAIVLAIQEIQTNARKDLQKKRPLWPMLIFRTPKGWTCPREVDGKLLEGTWRSHQVPFGEVKTNPAHLKILEAWMKSYRPEELFDEKGAPFKHLSDLAPQGNQRMGCNPHANGGLLLKDLKMPDFRTYGVPVSFPGENQEKSTFLMGQFLRDVIKLNWEERNFRVFGPDETASNRLNALFEITDRVSTAEILSTDEHISPDGRVMEVLSEHLCEGWLEGYLLTGRHGFFSCYEAFIHIIDSMFNQHAKWLKASHEIPWRQKIASLNYLLTSHVWRQDHNGFSHQDPGFIDHVLNKKADIVRIYLPPDANTLLSVTDHCLKSRNYINLIIAGKQPQPQWLDMESAQEHCSLGMGIWQWASNKEGSVPDVIMACSGDVPTLETLAAVEILWKYFPELKVRTVNVVDLMTLQPESEHPHGTSDLEYNTLFPPNVPVIFAFHGYPSVIHRLTYKRANNPSMHVHGYKEEGTTTTPFDMTVLNSLDRFHLAEAAIDRIPHLASCSGAFKQFVQEQLFRHKEYIQTYGEDLPEIQSWKWVGKKT